MQRERRRDDAREQRGKRRARGCAGRRGQNRRETSLKSARAISTASIAMPMR
jgi:hypothetical protein